MRKPAIHTFFFSWGEVIKYLFISYTTDKSMLLCYCMSELPALFLGGHIRFVDEKFRFKKFQSVIGETGSHQSVLSDALSFEIENIYSTKIGCPSLQNSLSTCACLPLHGTDFPGGLTHPEMVTLRRTRLGVALTPAVRATWTSSLVVTNSACPYCPTSAAEATLDHPLGTCPGLQPARTQHMVALGHRPGHPPNIHQGMHGQLYKLLQVYLTATGLYSILWCIKPLASSFFPIVFLTFRYFYAVWQNGEIKNKSLSRLL